MKGDHSLFPDQAVEDETWRIVEPILTDPPKIQTYEPGTWGPRAAIDMACSIGGWREPPPRPTDRSASPAPPIPREIPMVQRGTSPAPPPGASSSSTSARSATPPCGSSSPPTPTAAPA